MGDLRLFAFGTRLFHIPIADLFSADDRLLGVAWDLPRGRQDRRPPLASPTGDATKRPARNRFRSFRYGLSVPGYCRTIVNRFDDSTARESSWVVLHT